ncbi:MAG: Fur family transcriptional regulator [Planctomycetota bacterium]
MVRQGGPRFESAAARLGEYLARHGMRQTAQRRAVLRAVVARRGHYTAEELCRVLEGREAVVSRSTVYRALEHLRDCGLVKEVTTDGATASYETVHETEHHDHMLCVECGEVTEFCDERIEQLQQSVCREHGFRPVEHRLSIRGTCRECRTRRKEE